MQIVLGHHAPKLSNGQTVKVIHAETGVFLFVIEPGANWQQTECSLSLNKLLEAKVFQVVSRDGNQF